MTLVASLGLAPLTSAGASGLSTQLSAGGAIEPLLGCGTQTLYSNDDGSSTAIPLPFPLSFFGSTYTYAFVNNNGNITFNGPLAYYTPELLTKLARPIIAPFWADIDTRGIGRVTYGNVIVNGEPGFCVDWNNVGYFNQETNKTNTFQLLILKTGLAAFNVTFNYSDIQWETGDVSGGSNGLGGTSALIGFSSGNGNPTQSYSLPGSMVPGSFLNSNPSTGLVDSGLNSTVKGRYVFNFANGYESQYASQTSWVALGDSYSSGEGSPVDVSPAWVYPKCHRSSFSWPYLLADMHSQSLSLIGDAACSGATTVAINNPYSDPYDSSGHHQTLGVSYEQPQINVIKADKPKLVTITIGGNDLGFGPILQSCYLDGIDVNTYDPFAQDCVQDGTIQDASGYLSTMKGILARAYQGIVDNLPSGATLAIVGYPNLFPSRFSQANHCSWMDIEVYRALSELQANFDTMMGEAVSAVVTTGGTRIAYLPMGDIFPGQELCTSNSVINPIEAGGPGNAHPNAIGQLIYARAVYQRLQQLGY